MVLMYDRTSEATEVNDARRQLFTQKYRTLENIPPTQAALKQHIKRTCYQANCWNQALVLDQEMPEPSDWGGQMKHATGTTDVATCWFTPLTATNVEDDTIQTNDKDTTLNMLLSTN